MFVVCICALPIRNFLGCPFLGIATLSASVLHAEHSGTLCLDPNLRLLLAFLPVAKPQVWLDPMRVALPNQEEQVQHSKTDDTVVAVTTDKGLELPTIHHFRAVPPWGSAELSQGTDASAVEQWGHPLTRLQKLHLRWTAQLHTETLTEPSDIEFEAKQQPPPAPPERKLGSHAFVRFVQDRVKSRGTLHQQPTTCPHLVAVLFPAPTQEPELGGLEGYSPRLVHLAMQAFVGASSLVATLREPTRPVCEENPEEQAALSGRFVSDTAAQAYLAKAASSLELSVAAAQVQQANTSRQRTRIRKEFKSHSDHADSWIKVLDLVKLAHPQSYVYQPQSLLGRS